MLKDQNLEHQHHDDLVQFNQRIALIEPGTAFIQVEESGLWRPFVLI